MNIFKNKYYIIPFLLLFIFSEHCVSQDTIVKGFVSANTGLYFPSRSDFNKIYSSPYAFMNGLSIGIPITKEHILIYAKAMYYSKKGIPITYHFVSKNGVSSSYTTQDTGNVTINQFLFNLGVQYNINLNKYNSLLVNGGINLVNFSEKSINPNSEIKGNGFAGYFLGLGIERKMRKLPLGTLIETQYNLDRLIFDTYGLSTGGLTINISIRYYFDM